MQPRQFVLDDVRRGRGIVLNTSNSSKFFRRKSKKSRNKRQPTASATMPDQQASVTIPEYAMFWVELEDIEDML